MMASEDKKISVVVLYNEVGEDWYETLKQVDPTQLPFKPEYPVRVSTIKEEYEQIASALQSEGYHAWLFNLENDLQKLEYLLQHNRPDVVFNFVESFHDDADLEGAIAGMLDLYGTRYTGSQPFALALCQDKIFTKHILLAHGLPTPRFQVFFEPRVTDPLTLDFPLIVKPACEDASGGIDQTSVVHDRDQLVRKLEQVINEFCPPALVEEFIDGPELHVSVWGNDAPQVLPAIEFDFSALPAGYPPLVSYAIKWNPLEESYHRVHTRCPAELPLEIQRQVEEIAKRAYEASWCRDYARLDIRLRENQAYILEVNPNPDLTPGVSFMDSAERAGYSFAATLARIVEMARGRDVYPTVPQTSREATESSISHVDLAASSEKISAEEGGPVGPTRLLSSASEARPVRDSDRYPLHALISRIDIFSASEKSVACELVDLSMDAPHTGYATSVAVTHGDISAFINFGSASLASGVYEIYWIAVDPRFRRQGLGRILIEECIRDVQRRNGRMLLLETSQHQRYAATRNFYSAVGFRPESYIRDYYAPGEDLVVYGKRF